jgi:hypothetical protein
MEPDTIVGADERTTIQASIASSSVHGLPSRCAA